jgi:hypothetical protein
MNMVSDYIKYRRTVTSHRKLPIPPSSVLQRQFASESQRFKIDKLPPTTTSRATAEPCFCWSFRLTGRTKTNTHSNNNLLSLLSSLLFSFFTSRSRKLTYRLHSHLSSLYYFIYKHFISKWDPDGRLKRNRRRH